MERLNQAVKHVDLKSKVLSGTLAGAGGVVEILSQAYAQHEFDQKLQRDQSSVGGGTEWGDLLDKFFVASKQIDDMYNECTPMFALTIPTPHQLPLPPTEVYSIPQLLSSSIAPEDVDKIKIPPKGSNSVEYREAIAKHNENLEGCINKFNLQIESWKKQSKRGEKRPRL